MHGPENSPGFLALTKAAVVALLDAHLRDHKQKEWLQCTDQGAGATYTMCASAVKMKCLTWQLLPEKYLSRQQPHQQMCSTCLLPQEL